MSELGFIFLLKGEIGLALVRAWLGQALGSGYDWKGFLK
jgi:hypothetical protein